MENILKMGLTQLFFGITILVLISCKNDDVDNPADALPPATEVGAGTLSCLINGEPFFPSNFGLSSPSGFYQFCCDGFFTLSIGAASNESPFIGIALGGADILPIEEMEYQLLSETQGNLLGRLTLGGGLELRSTTTDENPGRLTITRFENENEFIIAGTFEFTVLDNEGNEIRITDGRFDIPFTN